VIISHELGSVDSFVAVLPRIRPGSPLATPEAELVKLPGFSRNMTVASLRAEP
jgi:hypothetical protein